ncbi:unnamed protein product [Chondrus crispus]|uniref:Hemimethylated DNA-binding domain-containing protein n=1 Tax=Chondrus crispus TaxID=2769 RepID=R7QL48_CHOCR|nr:unnamed protein product [Chondrus crispus]CDF38211.1 unnamed protein product [Chondrus crispus]|eukprot:XP_005718096.1 unnamed protein product [Chondrus crispus]
MLAVAVADEDYRQAAQLRDAAEQLDAAHPTFALRRRLEAALSRQDFARAAALRDEIDRVNMHAVADRCKPRYPLGLVVVHRRLSYRMVLFGADYRCRAPRATAGQAWGSRRGELQPWYHAAVDERDKSTGDNIVYVAEDDCVPAPPGVQVQHPITRIMFRGLHSQRACPGYSWYVPVGNEEAENMRCVDG